MRSHRIPLVSILMALAFGSSMAGGYAIAATYHVSPFGSNTPPYDTYAKAAHGVKDAADSAVGAGDTVLVHAGSYTSTDTIRIAAGVTWAGVGRDSVTLIWGDTKCRPGLMAFLLGGNEVYGLEFQYPPPYWYGCDMVTAVNAFNGLPVKVRDCRFIGARAYSDGSGSVELCGNEFQDMIATALSIHNSTCFIHGNRFDVQNECIYAAYAGRVEITGNSFTGSIAIYVNQCDSVFIRNNLTRNCLLPLSWFHTNGLFENNTALGAGFTWYSLEVFQDTPFRLTIRNNMFVDVRRPIGLGPACFESCYDTAGTTTIVDNVTWPPRDSLYMVWPPDLSPGRVPVIESLNVYAYPMFADDSTYCPQAGSPLIDRGDPSILDVDGTRSDIGWTGGPGGVTCGYLQLPPLPPESLHVSGGSGVVALVWSSRPESDLASYRVYREATSGFWHPGLEPLKTLAPSDTTAVDTVLVGSTLYYVVTAVDTAGLESGPSPEGSYLVSGIADDPSGAPIPRTPYIARVYPNPFNAATVIEVDVPETVPLPVALDIRIFDVLGRRVALRASTCERPGLTLISWDAEDDQAHALASGVYFVRLSVADHLVGRIVTVVLMR